MSMLIDTHSHIYSEEFSDDRDEVVQRALENGIEKIILPNIDSSSIKPMLDLTKSFPGVCYPLIGIHPTSINEDYESELQIVKYWLNKRPFYGIGEIGIDLYWDKTFIEQQIKAFRTQIRWAKEFNLPVVIHVRNSFTEVFEVIQSEMDDNLRGIFHSFSGTPEEAKKIVDWGFKLGINGIVTFKNSGLDKVVGHLSMEDLVLETDAPYLAPTPFRGKRNECSYLPHIAYKLTEIFDLSLEEVSAISSKNAREIFSI